MTVWCCNIPKRQLVGIAERAEYFDMLTLEPIQDKQPVGPLQAVMMPRQYHDEQGIVFNLRKIREALIEANNDEVAAKKYAVGNIYNLLQDCIMKEDNYLFYIESDYDDWMWVYKQVMTSIA